MNIPDKVAMAWSEMHQRMFVMEEKTIDVWDIVAEQTVSLTLHIDGLVQERRNSSALAMELRLSCTNPSIWRTKIMNVFSGDTGAAD